jgi:peptide-methionine (S)-S-oxide reductase
MTRTHRHSTLLAAAVLIAGGLAVTTAAQQTSETAPVSDGLAKATFAGGCFWCMEPPFDELDGVISTTSGYTGGDRRHPAYQEVASGQTKHAEAVEIVYDPAKISYAQLLEVFWMNVDPLTLDRQFCDGGAQYRTAIFFHGDEQARLARDTKQQLDDSGGGRLPPGLLSEEPDPIQVLPIRLRPRQAARRAVGRRLEGRAHGPTPPICLAVTTRP